MLAAIVATGVLALIAVVAMAMLFHSAARYRRDARRALESDDGPARRREARAAKDFQTARTCTIVAGTCGGLALVLTAGFVLLAARPKAKDETTSAPVVTATPADPGRPGPPRPPLKRLYDHENLPIGNDYEAVMFRLNARFQQNDSHNYWIETGHLDDLRKIDPEFNKQREVFRTFRTHAGTPAAAPHPSSPAHTAWSKTLEWATPAEVPDLCQMLTAERVQARQDQLFGKLDGFRDTRCAATVAPYLATPQRGQAEQVFKHLDSSVERLVTPYLAAQHHHDTREAALRVLTEIGTAETARLIEPLTRDNDFFFSQSAKRVYADLSKKYALETDLLAAVRAARAGSEPGKENLYTSAAAQLKEAARPDHPKRAEVFKALMEWAAAAVRDQKKDAADAACLLAMPWAAAGDVRTLCEALVATGGNYHVFMKLKEFKDVRSADTVAAFLASPFTSHHAKDVLRAIGPEAQKAVTPYAMKFAPNGAEIDGFVRGGAIEVLGDIGTKECLPLLQQCAADLGVRDVANKAGAKILNRLQGR